MIKVPQSIEFASILDHSVGDFPSNLRLIQVQGYRLVLFLLIPSLATVVGEYVYPNGAEK